MASEENTAQRGNIPAKDNPLSAVAASAFRKPENAVIDNLPGDPRYDDEPLIHVEFKTVVRFFKASFLFVVWLVMFVTLMLHPIHERAPRILSVAPNGTKYLRTPSIRLTDLMAITIIGPFIKADEFFINVNESAKLLRTQLRRTFYDQDRQPVITVNVSEVWAEHVVEEIIPERTRPVEKEYIFEVYQNVSQDTYTRNHFAFWTNFPDTMTMKVLFDRSPPEHNHGIICAALVLTLLYVLIIWDLMHRTVAAIFCSTVAIGILSTMNPRPAMQAIMKWIDVETLLLLFSLMILVAIMTDAGAFDYFALETYKLSKGNTWVLINSLSLIIAVVSAFLDNVTIMLLVSPVIIKLCEALILEPESVLTFMLIYANVGAAATPIGSPANLVISTHPFIIRYHYSFGFFMLHLAPCTLIVLVQTYYQLRFKYRSIDDLQFRNLAKLREEYKRHVRHAWRRLANNATGGGDRLRDVFMVVMRKVRFDEKGKLKPLTFEETVEVLANQYASRNKALLAKSTFSVVLVGILYFLHSILAATSGHMSLGWMAFLAAVLLVIIAEVEDVQALLARVDWSTLIFFAALFMLIEVTSQMGLLEAWGNVVVRILLSLDPAYQMFMALMLVYWVTALFSAVLSNVPMTSMMLRIVISLAENDEIDMPLAPLVWALALGASFGGNGTLLAASANMVTVGVAERLNYKMNFMRFFKVGFPIMLSNGVVASIYLIFCHVIFQWHQGEEEEDAQADTDYYD